MILESAITMNSLQVSQKYQRKRQYQTEIILLQVIFFCSKFCQETVDYFSDFLSCVPFIIVLYIIEETNTYCRVGSHCDNLGLISMLAHNFEPCCGVHRSYIFNLLVFYLFIYLNCCFSTAKSSKDDQKMEK